MSNHNKLILIILDGWGHGKNSKSDAIQQANTPFVGGLYDKVAHAELVTYGPEVGLPKGQMGNSEVGHLNIGAGRVVYQELLRINNAIEDQSFFSQAQLEKLFASAKKSGRLHLMGLLSDGGIHSHISHLKALCQMAMKRAIPEVYIHCFTDGRDTDPKSGLKFITELDDFLQQTNIKIASISGRYYAMDRDKRWPRIKLAYDALVNGKGQMAMDAVNAMIDSYDEEKTDEFVLPTVMMDEKGEAIGKIKDGDAVLCINFRTDRCRQITEVLTQNDFPAEEMKKLKLDYYTMTEYDAGFKGVEVVYTKDNLSNTIGEVIANAGLSQMRAAETEKYPHVTFFFSGGREAEFEKEIRIMAPSPKVATYDLQPEMSAFELKDKVIASIKSDAPDFICLNFANPDMVGHTGVLEAVIKAVETVDQCTSEVVKAAQDQGYSAIIIADHGNADLVINPDGSPNTAHTTNPVPIFVLGENISKVKNGKLADIAPTILKMMNVDIPEEMTGDVLV